MSTALKQQRANQLVYAALVTLCLSLTFWQYSEHQRVVSMEKQALITRANDISSTLGLVMRSQRRFGGLIVRPRMESALSQLIDTRELKAIALFNSSMQPVASAGDLGWKPGDAIPEEPVIWTPERLRYFTLVDLGIASTNSPLENPLPIVVDAPEENSENDRRRFDNRRRFRREPGDGPDPNNPTNRPPYLLEGGEPPSPFSPRLGPGGSTNRPPREGQVNFSNRPPPRPSPGDSTNRPPPQPPEWFRNGRPPWLSEAEFDALKRKAGVHGFILEISTAGINQAIHQDRLLRFFVVGFGFLACLTGFVAWRNLIKSADFEVRLVRAREQNTHLQEMNLAAAGLAHETRNPLNLIRGVAQMISKREDLDGETRKQCGDIAEEVDRVTAQLNEFISYSKPREIKRLPVLPHEIIQDVIHTLRPEMEDLGIEIHSNVRSTRIYADEKLLRQVIFNLLLNSIQAMPEGGRIQVQLTPGPEGLCILECTDNGPGIPMELRTRIFQPYFTTRAEGTGLGLAILRQIAMAHGWDLSCFSPEGGGAGFRITNIEIAKGEGSEHG